jgi:membrane-bound lytic murein transglycosylase D
MPPRAKSARGKTLRAGAVLLALSVGCATGPRSNLVAPTALPPTPRSSIVAEATERFYAGKAAALAGDFDCARTQFEAALDLVAPETGRAPATPDFREFSTSLYESISRYEALAQTSQDPDTAEPRGTPEELLGVSGQTSDDDLARARQEVESDPGEGGFDIPLTINDQVLAMVAAFSSRDSVRQRFAEGLARSGRYMAMIESVFQREGLPRDLAYVAMIESSFKPQAHSRARAHGLWQFISSTGRRYGLKSNHLLDERSDPVKSTEAAAAYFKDLFEIFDDWYLSMAAYDAGEGRVLRAMQRTGLQSYWDLCRAGALPRETRLYVPSVLAAALIAKNPDHYGFQVRPEAPMEFETVELHRPLSLRQIARASRIGYEDLSALNPELKRGVTPKASGGYELRVPQGARETVLANLGEVPTAKVPTATFHRIRRGDTLSGIAHRYRVSIGELAAANHLSRRSILRVNRVLVIPERGRSRIASGAARSSTRTRTARYRVRKGDTLYAIAARHHVPLEDLRRWNGIGEDDVIHPGDHLRIARTSR